MKSVLLVIMSRCSIRFFDENNKHSFSLQGRNGAVCVIALAERGALFDPGPCMYMEKLAVGPAVDPKSVSLDKSIADNLAAVAKALNKPVG